ncbi:hypothetical protein [Algoriphagus boritolerans]|uniref:Uncharacterized protein n=1 Tax=Algoriphagus boritolerans DSM 17298 = JCM 18970 TaxID=1120964 RepID=A0A1H5XGG8_9BACT|nr:hypothetical protein [Algoriphagus boritolerans]SEG10447.1 hypothetical protein SAMN03080598_02499 [Algoriphagus boritolerans DSM 17298 = JCM 18970]
MTSAQWYGEEGEVGAEEELNEEWEIGNGEWGMEIGEWRIIHGLKAQVLLNRLVQGLTTEWSNFSIALGLNPG